MTKGWFVYVKPKNYPTYPWRHLYPWSMPQEMAEKNAEEYNEAMKHGMLEYKADCEIEGF